MKRRLKVLLFTILIFIIPLAITLGAIELAFRYVNTRNATDFPNFTYNAIDVPLKIKSNYHGVVGGIPITTNRNGFRDEPELAPTPPPNEFRILSMGDSIAFGLGISSRDAYAKVFERQMNQGDHNPRYNVINAAGPGYSPSAYYIFLRDEALQLNPKMVIVEIELTNDVSDEALLRWDADPADPHRPKRVRGGRYVTAWDGMLLSAYVRGPYFYEKTYTYVELSRRMLNLLYQRAAIKPYPPDPSVAYYTLGYEWYLLNNDRIESGWSRLFDSVKAINDLLKSRGVTFLLMVMPSRYSYETNGASMQFARGVVTRAIDFAQESHIDYLDLTDAIGKAGGTEVFLDTVHLNPKGNAAVAAVLSQRLSAP